MVCMAVLPALAVRTSMQAIARGTIFLIVPGRDQRRVDTAIEQAICDGAESEPPFVEFGLEFAGFLAGESRRSRLIQRGQEVGISEGRHGGAEQHAVRTLQA